MDTHVLFCFNAASWSFNDQEYFCIFTQKTNLLSALLFTLLCVCVCLWESERARESESVQKEAWHVLNYLSRPSSEAHWRTGFCRSSTAQGENERTSWRPEPKAGWKLDWGENSVYNIPFPIWQHSSITFTVNMFSLFVAFVAFFFAMVTHTHGNPDHMCLQLHCR